MSKSDRRRDAFTLAVAALLLALGAGLFYLWTERARERRDLVLQGVPEFPRPGQQVVQRRAPLGRPAPPPKPVETLPAPAPKPAKDRLAAFALAPTRSVAVVQINALLNTPLWTRFKECAPDALRQVEAASKELGLDFERDLDRAAIVPGGIGISGFFEGKPIAERLAAKGGEYTTRDYRGQTLYTSGRGSCVAQLGTLVVAGRAESCEGLVDRALDGEAGPDASQELYGDLYARTDLKDLRERFAGPDNGETDVFGTLVKQLDGVTLRANVWDQVALSVDGVPADNGNAGDLSKMARAAISLAKTQIGEDDVELRTLADLAQVRSEGGKLKLDLAMSVDDLFDKLHLPCPGRDGAPKPAAPPKP
jgi:hypothetical protein